MLARVWAVREEKQCFVNAGLADRLCALRIDAVGGG